MSSCYRAMAVTTPTWKLSYFPERDEGDTVVAMVMAVAMVVVQGFSAGNAGVVRNIRW